MRWKSRKRLGWFAWHPVLLDNDTWIWLERIHRTRGIILGTWYYHPEPKE